MVQVFKSTDTVGIATALRETATAGMLATIDQLRKVAIEEQYRVIAEFYVAKTAMETLAPSASDEQLVAWIELAVHVGMNTGGQVHIDAYALAYKLSFKITNRS